MKQIVYIIGILAILVIAGAAIFKYALPADEQRKIIRDLDLEESPIVQEISKKAFVELEIQEAHLNLLGNKWVISTSLRNTNEDVDLRQVGLRYHFTDGSEDRYYSVDLRAERLLPSVTRDKISGHAGETLVDVEVISAE